MTKNKSEEAQVFKNFATNEYISDETLKRRPTKKDLQNVNRILHDFGISKGLQRTDFDTVFELQKYMREEIKNKLGVD